MRPGPTIAAISLALAWGDHGYAAGVFLPVDASVPGREVVQTSAGEMQGRFVRIAHDELQRARAEVGDLGRSRLLFNMGGRAEFDVTVERTAQTLDGYTLSGHINGGKGGFVTLAVHQQMMASSIWTWEANYEVMPIGDGVHAVREVVDEPLECGAVAQAPSVQLQAPAPTSSVSDAAAVVDILIFWTTALEAAKGGESSVKLAIDLAIAFANDALERSGALVSLNLVGSERLDVEEMSDNDVLDVLGGEYAAERADALGADFISAFANVIGGSARGGESVVGGGDPYVFAHEVGHNLGLLHDRGAWGASSRSYNGGYVSIETDDHLTRCDITIMSYGTVCRSAGAHSHRVPYYSTPSRFHSGTGAPLGVSRLINVRSWDGPADAVLAINRNRHRASDIRQRRSAP